jgi:hypothetical protein
MIWGRDAGGPDRSLREQAPGRNRGRQGFDSNAGGELQPKILSLVISNMMICYYKHPIPGAAAQTGKVSKPLTAPHCAEGG